LGTSRVQLEGKKAPCPYGKHCRFIHRDSAAGLQERSKGWAAAEDGGRPQAASQEDSDLKTVPDWAQELSSLNLVLGNFAGEGVLTDISKLVHLIPWCSHKQARFCPQAQCGACFRHEDVPCPFSHEILPSKYWAPAWHAYFMLWGGHLDWQGSLPVRSLLTIMDPPMIANLAGLQREARSEALLYHVSTRLQNLAKRGGEHLPVTTIQQGSGKSLVVSWPKSAHTKLAACSGEPAHQWFSGLVGHANEFFRAEWADMGETVQIPGGRSLGSLCALCAVAGSATQSKPQPHRPGLEASFILLMQTLQQLVSTDIQALHDEELGNGNKAARLYDTFGEIGEGAGLADNWLARQPRRNGC